MQIQIPKDFDYESFALIPIGKVKIDSTTLNETILSNQILNFGEHWIYSSSASYES